MKLDYTNRNVVVTGGTGALGAAVVQALLEAGATCYLPAHGAPKATQERVKVTAGIDLANEASVRGFYESLPSLWSSIHIAGGFAAAPIADTSLEQFQGQFSTNTVTVFLCCREAVKKIARRDPKAEGS